MERPYNIFVMAMWFIKSEKRCIKIFGFESGIYGKNWLGGNSDR